MMGAVIATPRVAPVRLIGLAALALLLLQGCPAARPAAPPVGAPSALDDRAPLEWARGEPSLVVVRRSCRTLTLYRHGQWVRTYDQVSFGREEGVKVYEGDRRTPDGLYRIVGKRAHGRWSRFMLLDYPNLKDRDVHRLELALGNISAKSPGGEIGIHGTDKERMNRHGLDWTFGCVSLMNADVNDLYDLVGVGTLVLIED